MKRRITFIISILIICLLSSLFVIGCTSDNIDKNVANQPDKNHQHELMIKSDGTFHWYECKCGYKTDKIQHKLVDKYNDTHHWKECECGYKTDKVAHNLSYNYNDSVHWQIDASGYKTENEEHEFFFNHDATHHWKECKCGYTRDKVETTYSCEIFNDSHIAKCDICGKTLKKEIHDIDPTTKKCKVCSYIREEDGTAELQYSFDETDQTYTVTGYTGGNKDIFIPSYKNGYRVSRIADGAFSNVTVKNIVVSPATNFSLGVLNNAYCDSINIHRNITLKNIATPYYFYFIGVKNIIVEKNHPTHYSIDNCIIEKETDKIIYGGYKCKIPKEAKIIGALSMVYIEDYLIMPDNIKTIESNAFDSRLYSPENMPKIYCPANYNHDQFAGLPWYVYRKDKPTSTPSNGEDGYWHYDADGVTPIIWK